jgi:sugar lactone lactonase YvrE
VITQQPANLSVLVGQGAAFTVAATGTAPLSYQWQRNGVDIAGATTTTYSLAATALTDSGATFRAVVSNVAGSATSDAATLTVSSAAPVLTISPQPASTSVTAGSSASFAVGGTCSVGTLRVQWQRSNDSGETWSGITGATATTYSLATVIGDNGARFRAQLDCSGQSGAASSAATLTVTAPGSVTLALLPIVGLRDQAQIPSMTGIDQDAAGSFTFITSHAVKRLSADLGTITPVAGGNGTGSADGAGAVASFNSPKALAHDAAGNIYVSDTNNHTIRRIASDGTVTTLAGSAGAPGAVDGTGAGARFASPGGIAIGPDGDLYVSDRDNHLVRRVTTSGVVTTYAGSTPGYLDGAANVAKFNGPAGIAVAANGDVLVADAANNRIRRVLRAGNGAGLVQTLAGNGTGAAGAADGIGVAAVIPFPGGLYVRGNTLTVRDNAGLLRQIDLTTTAVTTLAGSRTLGEGYADGPAATARLRNFGFGITGAPSGGWMVADDIALRTVSAAGDVRTIAASAALGATPTGVGVLAQMPFGLAVNNGQAVTVDAAGNVVIADATARLVRRISPTGVVTLVAGLTGGYHGVVDGVGSGAQFADVGISIAQNSAGVLFVGDQYGVRRIGTDTAVSVLTGSTTTFGSVDGDATTARFNRVFGLAVGPGGDVFAGDLTAVRRINSAGTVTTYAGVLGQGGGADGPIATARFQFPGTLAFLPDGSLYVLERLGGTIRRIAPDGSSVSTLTGVGLSGTFTVDSAGTLYYGGSSGGLFMQPLGGVTTTLIPAAPSVVLGSSPAISNINAIAVLGPKQLVILSGSQILKATLP